MAQEHTSKEVGSAAPARRPLGPSSSALGLQLAPTQDLDLQVVQRQAETQAAHHQQNYLSLQREEENDLQTHSQQGLEGSSEESSPKLVQEIQSRRGQGQILSSPLRQQLELGFGSTLPEITIHTDSEANSLSNSVSAKAFTTGSDIFFRQGAFNPDTSEGIKLIAHEATHVVQQSRYGIPRVSRLSDSSDASEIEAHRNSHNLLAGRHMEVSAIPTTAIARDETNDEEIVLTQQPPGSQPQAQPQQQVPDRAAMERAATNIFNAVDGLGTDEDAIHAALRGRTSAETQMIREIYRDHYGRSLDADLADELSDTDLEQARAAMSGDPVQAAVATLVNASGGVGTNEAAIQQTLRGITDPDQRRRVAEDFEQRTGHSLDQMLEEELSDSDLEISSLLSQGRADEADAVALDAAMHETTLGIDFGTDETRINELLEGTSEERRTQILEAYRLRTGNELSSDLSNEMSGAEADVSLRLADGDRTGAMAARIANAAEGLATDEATIFGQFEGRSDSERQEIIRAFNEQYRDRFGSFDAVIADEMDSIDAERARQLAEHGRLDPVFALQYAQSETGFLGIGTDEEMVRQAFRGSDGRLLSAEQIREIQLRYRDTTGEDLSEDLGSELSGRDEHYIMQIMRGEPENIEERLRRAEENYEFERGEGSGFGSFTDMFYDAGNMLDRQHGRLSDLQTRLQQAATPEERSQIEAEINRVMGYQESDVQSYHVAQDSVANNAAMVAGAVAAAAATIATGGVAGPAVAALATQLGITEAAAAAMVAAAASGAASMGTRGIILGHAYEQEAIATDAAMTIAQVASAGVLSSGTFRAAEGELSGFQQILAGRGIDPAGMSGMLLEQGAQGLTQTAITGTVQASLDEQVWQGSGHGALRFAEILGTGFLQNSASGVASSLVGRSLGSNPASGVREGLLRGSVSGLAGGVAQTAVDPNAWSGRWEDVTRRFGTNVTFSAFNSGISSTVEAHQNLRERIQSSSDHTAPFSESETSSSIAIEQAIAESLGSYGSEIGEEGAQSLNPSDFEVRPDQPLHSDPSGRTIDEAISEMLLSSGTDFTQEGSQPLNPAEIETTSSAELSDAERCIAWFESIPNKEDVLGGFADDNIYLGLDEGAQFITRVEAEGAERGGSWAATMGPEEAASEYASYLSEMPDSQIRDEFALPREWNPGVAGNPIDEVAVRRATPTGFLFGEVAEQYEAGDRTVQRYPGGAQQYYLLREEVLERLQGIRGTRRVRNRR